MDGAARQIAREAAKRFTRPADRVLSGSAMGLRQRLRGTLFKQQLAFVDDPAKSKAALCTRRAGKTTTCGADELDAVLEKPGTEALFLALTREKAKELLWGELKRLNFQFQIGIKWDEVALLATLPEGLGSGRVKLAGADKAKEIEKRRGSKFSRARIDEAQAFGEFLKPLIEDVLEPALLDYQGDLALLGTPGIVCAGIFHDVTTGKVPGWSVHRWSLMDNPHLPHAAAWLAAKKLERGWSDDEPTLLREYHGQWVSDTGALFYRYDEARNSYATLPKADWHYVVGVDLGFDDAFAYVVWAFCATSPILYEVESFSESALTPSEWFARLRVVNERYSPRTMQVDTGGLGKAIVEDAKDRYPDLPLEPAKKKDKPGAVAMLNSDLVAGLVKVRPQSLLAEEWKRLPKDPDNELAEDPRFANHASDAGLYGHRYARHFLGEVPEEAPRAGTPTWAAQEAARMEAAMVRRVERQKAERREELVFGFEEETWEDDLE